ncbi:MAG: hypothetical protein ACXVHB_12930 [Solirubrobacteraceae bacterium]
MSRSVLKGCHGSVLVVQAAYPDNFAIGRSPPAWGSFVTTYIDHA